MTTIDIDHEDVSWLRTLLNAWREQLDTLGSYREAEGLDAEEDPDANAEMKFAVEHIINQLEAAFPWDPAVGRQVTTIEVPAPPAEGK